MKIATSRQMKSIDRRAIRVFGIPGTVLMENAAVGIMAEMDRFFDGLDGTRIAIICGKGNNGGDGFALARRLRIRGNAVRVALLSSFDAVAGEAKINLAILRRMNIDIVQNAPAKSLEDIISWSDILVDALIGVGLSSPLRGSYARAASMINAAGKPVVAIDIPSGIDADTGAVMGIAVQADLTVTMGILKRGLMLFPGARHAGVVRIADLGMPNEVVEQEAISVELLDHGFLQGLLARRAGDAHKGDFGHLAVIAGSPGKAGAALLAARGALRAGAGLVSIAAPNNLVPIIQSQLAEAMCIPSAESIEGTLGIGAEEHLLTALGRMSACVIGPGLSTHHETVQVVRGLAAHLTIPVVIDADGLNALSGHVNILKRAKASIILTPHPGEMGRLLGISADEVQKDRIAAALDFARMHGVIVVLKGAGTIIAAPDGRVFINATGNPGMATGGTGDVLAGMIGSFLAQGFTATQAACLGVYLHGAAGDLATREGGEAGIIAGDLIERIPAAIKQITEAQC